MYRLPGKPLAVYAALDLENPGRVFRIECFSYRERFRVSWPKEEFSRRFGDLYDRSRWTCTGFWDRWPEPEKPLPWLYESRDTLRDRETESLEIL